MRKLIAFNFITLDGFFEGPNKEIDWHNVDEEFNEFAIEQLNSVDEILFGKITYELMANYWPTEHAVKDDPVVANKMNSSNKFVFSKTLKKAEWNNTKLIHDNIENEIVNLKNKDGKDIIILGSGNLISNLMKPGLIDEFRLMINPVIIGSGKTLF
jgi:dihydrofolate reductase